MSTEPIKIIQRPEKTLSDGTVSRWNGSRTPLIYKFLSERFPVNNNKGEIRVLQESIFNSGEVFTQINTNISYINLGIGAGDLIYIDGTGTSLDGGYYEAFLGNSTFILYIKEPFSGVWDGVSGTVNRVYKDYKVFAKVFAGAPSYHPYNKDGSKPKIELGTLQVDFDSNNEGICNVRNYIKGDINSDFDSENENSHYSWTSFNIEYAEYWEGKEFISYEADTIENCQDFTGFENDDFSNGLTDWQQRSYIYDEDESFVNNGGLIQVQIPAGNETGSKIIYQDVQLITGNKYQLTLEYSKIFTNGGIVFVHSDSGSVITRGNISGSGSGSIVLGFTVGFNTSSVGISFYNTGGLDTDIITLNELSIIAESGAGSPCEYSSFALLGTKQFQDPYGGNFIDYVLRPFIDTDEAKPKILTHFDELRLFPTNTVQAGNRLFSNYRNYVTGIIPDSTFSLSDSGDDLFLQIQGETNYDGFIDKNIKQIKIDNNSDGVYTYDFSKAQLPYMDKGDLQFIIKPGNTLADMNNGQFNPAEFVDWGLNNVNDSLVGGAAITSRDISNSQSPIPNSLGGGVMSVLPLGTPILPGEYKVLESTSNISVVEGLEYELTYFVANEYENGTPDYGNVVYTYWLPSGYTKEDCLIVDEKLHTINGSVEPDGNYNFTELKTTFIAKATEDIVLNRYVRISENINIFNPSPFAYFVFADMTFKGPINQISQPINFTTDTDCFQYKTNTLRWLNDLGGWESWTFKQYETVKESVNRTEIKHDIFNDFDNYFINGERQYQTVNVNSRKTVTVRSGHLNDNEFEVLAQIKRSIEVQMLIGEKYQTVSIANGSFTSIEEEKKVREIIFDVKLPETLVQDI